MASRAESLLRGYGLARDMRETACWRDEVGQTHVVRLFSAAYTGGSEALAGTGGLSGLVWTKLDILRGALPAEVTGRPLSDV